MGIFVTRSRRSAAAGPGAGKEPPETGRHGVPTGFEAVGEALASGSDPSTACTLVGKRLAADGTSLAEGLDQLRRTWAVVRGAAEPDFATTRALAVAWSEAALTWSHQLSCEDPMTGLATAAHLHTRLGELYRSSAGDRTGERWALVVVDTPISGDGISTAYDAGRVGRATRTVFPDAGAVGQARIGRVVAVVGRDERLGRRTALLRCLLEPARPDARVWIEGLPPGEASAGLLLAELART